MPNWGQALIAQAVGINPDSVVVRVDDDRSILFLELKTRAEYLVSKVTGEVTEA